MTQRNLKREDSNSALGRVNLDITGGLNRVSSPLNSPYSDSPSMFNVDITERGGIAKRPGTNLVKIEPDGKAITLNNTTASGFTLTPVKLTNGRSVVVAVYGTGASIYLLSERTLPNGNKQQYMQWLMGKPNIFAEPLVKKLDWTLTNEPIPRVFYSNDITPPIQFSFYQTSQVVQSSDVTNGYVEFSYSPWGHDQTAVKDSMVLFVNGELQDTFTVTNSPLGGSSDMRISYSGLALNDVVEVVYITWQWFCDALRLQGRQIQGKGTQFQVSAGTDNTVEIPTDLLVDIDPVQSSSGRYYPIALTKNIDSYATIAGVYTPNTKPSTSDQYTFTLDGVYTAGTLPLIGNAYAAIGGFTGTLPQPPRDVFFFRHWLFPSLCPANLVQVWKSPPSIPMVQNTNAYNADAADGTHNATYAKVANSYRLVSTNNFYTLVTGSSQAGAIRFDSIPSADIAPDDVYEILLTNKPTVNDVTQVLGFAAKDVSGISVASRRHAKDGAFLPLFGLSDYGFDTGCNCTAIFQNRLVLGGNPTQPLRLVFSEVADRSTPGRNWENLQTFRELNPSDPNAAFSINLQGDSSDYIVGMVEFQNNLFVMTRNNLYRVHGGDSVLSPTNVRVNFVANIGLLTPAALDSVDNTFLFLSSSGVYNLLPTIEAGDFTAGESSLKLRGYFGKSLDNEIVAWSCYDQVEQSLYVGLAELPDSRNFQASPKYASRIVKYSVLHDAWTEYGGFAALAGAYLSTNLDRTDVIFAVPSTGYPSDRIEFLTLDDSKTTDYTTEIRYADLGGSTFYTRITPIHPKATDTFNGYTTEVPIRFKSIPVSNYRDVALERQNSSGSWFLTEDVLKTERGSALLTEYLTDGEDFAIVSQTSDNKFPISVWVDNIRLEQGTDYTVTSPSNTEHGTYVVTLTNSYDDDAVVRFGGFYRAWWTSPTTYSGSLSKAIRVRHFVGYFINETDWFDTGDINSASGQRPDPLTMDYKKDANAGVAIQYGTGDEGFLSEELYGTDDLVWDESNFDFPSSSYNYHKAARIVVPIFGSSYAIQTTIFSYDDAYFEFVGYELSVSGAGFRSTERFT